MVCCKESKNFIMPQTTDQGNEPVLGFYVLLPQRVASTCLNGVRPAILRSERVKKRLLLKCPRTTITSIDKDIDWGDSDSSPRDED